MEIKIINAEYVNDYKIRLEFNDGKVVTIDFDSFLKNTANPMTAQYLDIKKFKKFKVLYGDLVWDDYELCFPIWDLYKGSIEKINTVKT